MIAHIPFDEKKYKEAIGVKELFGEKGYSTLNVTVAVRLFDVCGIWGGYTGEGSKTVLPSKAYAKVSCRLVPHQDHHKISQMFADYILSIAPDTVQVKVTPMHGGTRICVPDFTSCLSGSREKVSRSLSGKSRWRYAVAEVFPSSLLSNRYWESKPY